MLCGMVGHPAQRYAGSAIPRQHMAYSGYHQQGLAQTPSNQHILAPGVAAYFNQDFYQGLISKQVPQHSPDLPPDQPSPATSNGSQEGDHPIGYGAFGVVW